MQIREKVAAAHKAVEAQSVDQEREVKLKQNLRKKLEEQDSAAEGNSLETDSFDSTAHMQSQ